MAQASPPNIKVLAPVGSPLPIPPPQAGEGEYEALRDFHGNESPNEKAALLFRLMEKRRLLGFEKSFKMSDNRLLSRRFLLGMGKHEVPQNSLFVICERMGMQDDHLDALIENLSDADVVHFGFEENESGCIYKVYLEYCNRYTSKNIVNETSSEPFLLHLAFKWNPLSPAKGTVARYICHPGLSMAEVSGRMSAIYSGARSMIPLEIAQGIVDAASLSAGHLMYLEVSEEGNPRLSFDLRLYEANLRLGEIRNFLFMMGRHYSIPEGQLEALFMEISEDRLGHLSGGIDRNGRDFMTVYHELNVYPARGDSTALCQPYFST